MKLAVFVCGDEGLNILNEVLKHDVFPALGCTEPIAVAYAASVAAKEVGGTLQTIEIVLDPGVYKNGFAVAIPNTGGERGNLIAGVLGALIAQPELKMEVMSGVTEDLLNEAKVLIQSRKALVSCDRTKRFLFIEVRLTTDQGTARAVVEGTHKNLVTLECNGHAVFQSEDEVRSGGDKTFRAVLKQTSISELVDLVEQMNSADYEMIQRGIA